MQMDDLSLTESDRNLGVYLVGVIKGYYEGYAFASTPTPETGRDGEGDRSGLGAPTASAPQPAGAETAPTAPIPIASTDPGSDPDAEGMEQGEDTGEVEGESALDAATRRGMVVGLRAIAEEFSEMGMVEAALTAERHADAMTVSTLRSFG